MMIMNCCDRYKVSTTKLNISSSDHWLLLIKFKAYIYLNHGKMKIIYKNKSDVVFGLWVTYDIYFISYIYT